MNNKDLNTLTTFLTALENLNMFNSHPDLQRMLTTLLNQLLPDVETRHIPQEKLKTIINPLYPIDK